MLIKNKVVVITGAGVSAESGLQTFRDANGLWNEHAVSDVATPQAWDRDPELVLEFYNDLRVETLSAEPNAAHTAIAELEKMYDVVVITQNIDDLHERAGSTHVIHVHGKITQSRSSLDETLLYDIGDKPINLGDSCQLRSQLRPHIVWFGESILNFDESREHIKTASRILVVGTSLSVYPAAGLLKKASFHAEKLIVALDVEKVPYGYKFVRAKAATIVPRIVNRWLSGEKAIQ